MGFGLRMIWGGLVCMVHAIIPGAFCTKGSDTICELHERMVINRRRKAESRAMLDGDAESRVAGSRRFPSSGAASPEAPCAGSR